MAKTLRLDGSTAPAFGIGAFTNGAQLLSLDTGAINTAYTLTMPATVGQPDQVLTTDGTGVLFWKSIPPSVLPNESEYTYDVNGNITTITDHYNTGISVTSISYNQDGMVTTVSTAYGGSIRTENYTYDADGNVIAMTAETT